MGYSKTVEIISPVDIINKETGEVYESTVREVKTLKHYNVKKLNFKGCIMELGRIMELSCRSKLDISIFWRLLDDADKNNEVTINQTDMAKQYKVSRDKIAKLIKKFIDVGFIKKVENRVYAINPFAFKSKACSTKNIEMLQHKWEEENE